MRDREGQPDMPKIQTHGNKKTINKAEVRAHGELIGKVETIKHHQNQEPEVPEISNHLGRKEVEDKDGHTQNTMKNTGTIQMTKNGMTRITLGKEDLGEHLLMISKCLHESMITRNSLWKHCRNISRLLTDALMNQHGEDNIQTTKAIGKEESLRKELSE